VCGGYVRKCEWKKEKGGRRIGRVRGKKKKNEKQI